MCHVRDSELVYLQVVKESTNVYSLDFFGPFSPIQAFSIALADIDLAGSNNFIYIVWSYDFNVKNIKNGSTFIQEGLRDARKQSCEYSSKCQFDKEEKYTKSEKASKTRRG